MFGHKTHIYSGPQKIGAIIKFSVCPFSHFFLSYAVAVIVGHAVFYSPSMMSYWPSDREATVRY